MNASFSMDNGSGQPRVGYVVKRYPRFSETFIVNEILAHEAAGLNLQIISIRPCNDTHFQDRIARVRAPLAQISSASRKAPVFWQQIQEAQERFPRLWDVLSKEKHADALTISQSLTLAHHALDNQLTHLHAHFASLPAAVARLASQFLGIPYSLTAHAKDIFHESVDAGDLRNKLTDAAAVITVSEFNVTHLVDKLGIASNKVKLIYNGMDLNALPFDPPVHRRPRIVAVGRLVEKKGFADLVRACSLLHSRGVEFDCQIIGGGEDETSLRHLVNDLQVHDLVQLTGPRPQAEVKKLVQDAAVMAAPCVVGEDGNRDGLPTVLLEAMALGTPCVSTAVTGIPEVVRHQETGIISAQHNPAELADNLQRLLTDSELRVRLATNARELIELKFDARTTSRKLRDIFAGKLGDSYPSRPVAVAAGGTRG